MAIFNDWIRGLLLQRFAVSSLKAAKNLEFDGTYQIARVLQDEQIKISAYQKESPLEQYIQFLTAQVQWGLRERHEVLALGLDARNQLWVRAACSENLFQVHAYFMTGRMSLSRFNAICQRYDLFIEDTLALGRTSATTRVTK